MSGPVAATPDRLRELGRAASLVADDLRRHGRRLADAQARFDAGTTPGRRLPGGLPAAVRSLAVLVEDVDGWAGQVGVALQEADRWPGTWLQPWALNIPRAPTTSAALLDVLARSGALHQGALAGRFDDLLDDVDTIHLVAAGRDPSLGLAVRDRLNRLAVSRTIAALQARPWLPRRDADRLEEMRALLSDWPELRVLSFRPVAGPDREPTLRVLLGDASVATATALYVPGTGHGLHTLAEDAEVARDLRQAARDEGRHIAVAVDLYDAPDTLLQARHPSFGNEHADELGEAVTDLRRLGAQRVVVVGHSYGSFAAGRGAAAGMSADALVLVGSPGVGADHVDDLGMAGGDVWVARAPLDPIEVAADADEWLVGPWLPVPDDFALGRDPADQDFGATVFEVNAAGLVPGDEVYAQGHSDYLRPGTTCLANIVRIVLGGHPSVPLDADVPVRLDQVDGPGWGLLDDLVPRLDPEWYAGTDASRADAGDSLQIGAG